MEDKVRKLMEGAYDVHLHATPCLSPRRKTILELAQEAKSYGMKGIVVKDHHFSTAPHSRLLAEVIPEVDVIGGVTLGRSVGGLNPAVVEATFQLGGKVVWMFSLDSKWMIDKMLMPGFSQMEAYRKLGVDPERGGYTICKAGTDELLDEAREIVALCKEYGCVMETSHLSPDEAKAIIKEGKKQGLERMVITHANQEVTPYPVELQKELVALGAMPMYCIVNYMDGTEIRPGSADELGALIRQIGVDHIVIGTDFGQPTWPSAVEGIGMMIGLLLEGGFTEVEVRRMVKANPERIYG
ncbi:MAG: DUF6282 family protein [Peptococcaceae bacterium]|nr:DUF6282 family protein [Peptococcaceae bacterium]